MTISIDDVKQIANLAHIKVSEDEVKVTLDQLSDIFKLIETMQTVDTSKVEPMYHAQDVMQRLREDEVTESDQHELYQSVAPHVEKDLYLVPKVIE